MSKSGQSERPKEHKQEPEFNISNPDLRDLYIRCQPLPDSLVDDAYDYADDRRLKGYLHKRLHFWFVGNPEDVLIQSAKVSVRVVDNLLYEKLPLVWIETYLHELAKKKDLIKGKVNLREAEALYRYVPPELVADFLLVHPIKLTQRQVEDLVEELTSRRQTTNEKLLSVLSHYTSKKHNYTDALIKNLIKKRRQDLAAKAMKRYHIPSERFPEVKRTLIDISARSMPKWERGKFSWEKLQEVYHHQPSAIACCIKDLYRKKVEQQLEEGLASILSRVPGVKKHLPAGIVRKLQKLPVHENKLRNDKFEPSGPDFVSLFDYGLGEEDVVWVTDKNFQESVNEMCTAEVIGIDTESTVARCTFDSNQELLSIVQIAAGQKVYVFDAKILKKVNCKSEAADKFFSDKNVTIVGHTLGADLNDDVTAIFGFKDQVKCQKYDIVPLFQKIHPGKKVGLKDICNEVFGKPLCKEYTLTDWDRRPLFKNQIHYAALDAFIALKLWEKLSTQKEAKSSEEKVPAESEPKQQQVAVETES